VVVAIALFVSLGLDTLAVSIGVGVSRLPRSAWLRLAVVFAAFEGGLPIVGLLLGRWLGPAIGDVATYLAAALLLVVAACAIREALDDENDEVRAAPTTWRTLLLTGFSIGIDELGIGFSLGVLGVSLGPALAYLAVQAFALTLLGLVIGERAGERLGERAELASGIALIVIAAGLALSDATGAGWR
jgi:putative Mn2+ efflux pump MntP